MTPRLRVAVGMMGGETQRAPEMVLRLGQRVQRVHRDAEIVVRLRIGGIEAQGFAFAQHRFLGPPLLQDGEAEGGPGVGAAGSEGEGGAVESLRLPLPSLAMQLLGDLVAQSGVDDERGLSVCFVFHAPSQTRI